MTSDEILRMSALAQAALVRSGALSARELVDLCLERIAKKNPELAAFVEVMEASARRDAERHDAKGDRTLPFGGVPIGIKDLNSVRGAFTRFGSKAFEHLYAPFDDATVARLRKAGFIFIGKTSTSEFGAMPVTEPDIHPPTRNPHDPRVSAGGSSGGSAAAVASYMVPLAQGSDGGGSIRIPSSFCGLYGFLPSKGIVEDPFLREGDHVVYRMGPIARCVEDAAAFLDVLAGITVEKPVAKTLPVEPFQISAMRPGKRLSIRFTVTPPLGEVETDQEVAHAVLDVAEKLGTLGHEVDEGAPPRLGTFEEILPVWQFLVAAFPVPDEGVLQPVSRWLLESGRAFSEGDIDALVRQSAARVLAWFGSADLWVVPTVAVSPPKIGAWKGLSPRRAFEAAAHVAAWTAPFNLSGQPAASIPWGKRACGIPIGVQLVGRPLDDATVLSVSRELEALRGGFGA